MNKEAKLIDIINELQHRIDSMDLIDWDYYDAYANDLGCMHDLEEKINETKLAINKMRKIIGDSIEANNVTLTLEPTNNYNETVKQVIKNIERNRYLQDVKVITWQVIRNKKLIGFIVTYIKDDPLSMAIYDYIGCTSLDIIECLEDLERQAIELYGITRITMRACILDDATSFFKKYGDTCDSIKLPIVNDQINLNGFVLKGIFFIKNLAA